MKANKIFIDRVKLRVALNRLGKTYADISRELGRNETYISNCIGEGYVTISCAAMLKVLYGINREDYERISDDEPVTSNEPQPIEHGQPPMLISGTQELQDAIVSALQSVQIKLINKDNVKNIISEAIIDAVISACSIDAVKAALQQVLYSAILGALKKIKSEEK